MPVKRDANVDANLGGKSRGVHFVCYRHRRSFAASGASLDLFLTSNLQISAQDGKKFHSNGEKKKKKKSRDAPCSLTLPLTAVADSPAEFKEMSTFMFTFLFHLFQRFQMFQPCKLGV